MMTTVVLSPAAARPSSPQPAPSSSSSSSSSSALVSSLAAAVAPSQDKAVAAALDVEGGGNGDSKALGTVVDENASVNVQPGQENDAAVTQQQSKHAKRAASPEMQRVKKKRRRVAFEAADIVEFEPTIFTTSVTSSGIPLGMSLKERSRTRRRLDSFELERQEHRVERQNYMEEGYLDPQERELILNQAGCEEPTMLSVEAEVNQIITNRRESNEIDFEFLYGLADMEEEQEEDSNQVMLEDEQEADEEEEEEEQEDDDGEESNQEDDTAAAFLSTSTTLEELSSDTEEAPDNNSTDEDAGSS